MTSTKIGVLTIPDAIALGTLLTAIQAKSKVRWLSEDGDILEGELRSIVKGSNNFDFMAWGTDIREGWVWITAKGFERTESVARLVELLQEGGFAVDE